MKKISRLTLLILTLVLFLSFAAACKSSDEPEPTPEEKYTVTFLVDGQMYQTVEVSKGAKLTLPSPPSLTDYEFCGWFFDKDVWANELADGLTVNENLTVHAHIKAKSPGGDTEGGEDGATACTHLEFQLSADKSYYTVTGIGKCTDTVVVIPDKYKDLPVLSIGEHAFDGYAKTDCAVFVEEFVIPDSITSIGANAFRRCTSLKGLTIPDSVTEIGNGILAECPALESLSLPFASVSYEYNGKTYLCAFGNFFGGAFEGCIETKQFTLVQKTESFGKEEAVTYIPEKLKTVTVRGGVIRMSCFENCTSIETVILEGVTEIGNYAFRNCTSLRSATIPDSVTSIGEGIFSGCTSLESASLHFVGSSAADEVNAHVGYLFGSKEYEGSLPTSYHSEQKYYLPASLESVTLGSATLPSGAFAGCSGIKSVTLAGGVTALPDSAFAGCASLTEINGIDGLSEIGAGAFNGCTSLTKFSIPSGVNDVKDYCFYGCSSLSELELHDKITAIGYCAFMNCTGLTSFTVPKSVTSLGESAFFGSGIKSITIPNTVSALPLSCFSHCASLTEVTVLEGVEIIGQHAFSDCPMLINISLPESLRSIEFNAFGGCTSITEITVPAGVTSIGAHAFNGCTDLNKLTVPLVTDRFVKYFDSENHIIPDNLSVTLNGGSIGESAFAFCKNITEIVIAFDLTEIGQYAFRGCTDLVSISLPDSLTTFGNQAFDGCTSLTSITIPEGVTSLGKATFFGCSSLSSINYNAIKLADLVGGNDVFNEAGQSGNLTLTFGGKVEHIPAYLFAGIYSSNDGEFINYVAPKIMKVVFEDNSALTSVGKFAFGPITHGISVHITDLSGWCETDFANKFSNPLWIASKLYVSGEKQSEVLTVPVGTERLGSCAFAGFEGITEVTIPESVTYINTNAFYGCPLLSSVTLENTSGWYNETAGAAIDLTSPSANAEIFRSKIYKLSKG